MTEPALQQEYYLKAHLLCHDVRLNTWIETRAWLDHQPDEQEAMHLLWPVGEAAVAHSFCEDCPFDLFDFTIMLCS
jgi:hypothetical protein